MHHPAHESLQEYQCRTGGTYDQWHEREYPAFTVMRLVKTEDARRIAKAFNYEYRGPGLGLWR